MRIGIVGVGRIGALHAETLHSLAEVEELVIVDADTVRAQELAFRLGARWAESTEDLLCPDGPGGPGGPGGRGGVDGLVIATPTGTHAALVGAAAEARIPAFCEKPVAGDIAGTKEVVLLAEGTDAQVQVGFQRRFDLGFVSAREHVRAKKLGWLHTVRAGTLDPAPPPASYINGSGGIFRDCSVHDFDAVRWVTGQEVREVYATGANRGAAYFGEAGDVATAAALLTLEDGTLALISATRYNAAGYDVRLELLGSEASISVGLDDRVPLRSVEPGVAWPAGPPYANFVDRFRPAYIAEMRAFIDMVAGRAANPCSPADALETFYVAEACELSRRERRPVTLAEVRL
jgi:myo-inositol 2-dehydrogenase/D-chiro-inositol 1-dehydrogenase